MENIQAINASMPVQCQAVPEVEKKGGAHSSPTVAKSGIEWKSPEGRDLTVCSGGVYKVVRRGWLKDAHRIHHRCCFAEQIKDYDASHIAVTVYCIIFVNLFFFL